MKRCSKCLLPETHETIEFNKEGKCNICIQHEYKNTNIDWNIKKKELNDLIEKFRGKNDYDCIIPFSGGKDSTWTLYYLKKEYKLNPLVVRFDHGFMRPNLEENIKKLTRKIGFDMITFTPNWKIVQRLMLKSFLDKGDFCWHCHAGIFSYPMWIALEKKIPLIFWGEKSSEYTSYYGYDQNEEVDEKRFDRYVNLGIKSEDMYLRLDQDIDIKQLKPYTFPPQESLKELNLKSVCLGSYIKWDAKKQSQTIQDKLGWKGDEVENVPPEYNYEKIECYMQGVRDYIKFIKRGYSRPSHLVALDLRNEKIDINQAKEQIKLYEGKKPQSLNLFLEFIGLNEEEFYEVAMSHQISPFKFQKKVKENTKKTKDFDKWSSDGKANREESLKELEKWKKEQQFFK
jgi:N-acetyl sugar amidotransferase|tara:strand:- start:1544 stop:2743 length:1200 start_codon:yes stop_codon:yes gene_type:complete